LTAYDQYAAQIFDEAGIPVLLVGDSASNNVFANETSLPVTADELIPLARAVSRSVDRALVVADLPFGSYQGSPEQAFDTAVRFMKETGAHAVKLEADCRWCRRSSVSPMPESRSWPISGSPRRPNTIWAAIGCKAADQAPNDWFRKRWPFRKPALSPSSWKWCRHRRPPR